MSEFSFLGSLQDVFPSFRFFDFFPFVRDEVVNDFAVRGKVVAVVSKSFLYYRVKGRVVDQSIA